MNTKEEIKETAEEITNNPSDYNYELYNLAKAYLDLVNAEPVAEVSAKITKSKDGYTMVVEYMIDTAEELNFGDKLYLRKE